MKIVKREDAPTLETMKAGMTPKAKKAPFDRFFG